MLRKTEICSYIPRGEFESDGSPDLNKDVYLQDIHCVSSLCKAYFRELPNPLLTYQLYDKFAVSNLEVQTFHTITSLFWVPEVYWRNCRGVKNHLRSKEGNIFWSEMQKIRNIKLHTMLAIMSNTCVLQEAVAIQLEEERLVKIRDVLKELPAQHHRYRPLLPTTSVQKATLFACKKTGDFSDIVLLGISH